MCMYEWQQNSGFIKLYYNAVTIALLYRLHLLEGKTEVRLTSCCPAAIAVSLHYMWATLIKILHAEKIYIYMYNQCIKFQLLKKMTVFWSTKGQHDGDWAWVALYKGSTWWRLSLAMLLGLSLRHADPLYNAIWTQSPSCWPFFISFFISFQLYST